MSLIYLRYFRDRCANISDIFLRYSYTPNQMDPHYRVASDKFYRGLLDKAFKKSVEKVENKIEKDNPDFFSCQLDGWSAYIGMAT